MSKDRELRERAEIKALQGLLSGRAGKLLKKGKPFIVVANDEPYFTAVYLIIREAEKAKGRWTEECEQWFQDLTHYDEVRTIPEFTPELQAVMREQVEKNQLLEERAKLREAVAALTGLTGSTLSTLNSDLSP